VQQEKIIMSEVKNADQLVKQVQDIINIQNDEVASKLKQYNEEVEANGKATKETTEQLVTLSEQFVEMSEKKDEMSQALTDINQKLTEGFDSKGKKAKTFGEQIVNHEDFARFKAGGSKKMALEVKNTILTESGSPAVPDHHLVAEDRMLGIVPLAYRALNVLDMIPTGTTTSDTIKFSKENSFTNSAAETAQGAAKPESAITYTSDQEYVETIATFLKISKQALRDAPMLESSVNARLSHMVRHRLQQEIIGGDGVSPNLSGWSTTGNHTDYAPVTGDLATDSLNKAKYAVIAADYEPNLIVMNPTDFGAIERIKTTSSNNDYAYGGGAALTYVNNGMTPLLWGLPVALSNDVTATEFFLMDRFASQLFMRENLRIEMFEQDEDNVQKNLITVRAELDAALAVYANAPIRYGTLTV